MLINLRNALMAGKRLPYDAELEYLESTGTQWIDTGLNYFADFEVGIKLRTSVPNKALGVGIYMCMERNSSNNPYWQLHINGAYRSSASIVDYHVMSWKDGVFAADGVTVIAVTNPFSSGTMMLFGAGGQTFPNMIYACKLWDAQGNLVRDFIPVRKGTVGYLYDRVSGRLFGNAGTGDFVIGQDVVPVEWLDGGQLNDGIAFIDTGYTPNSSTKIEATAAVLSARGYSGRFGNRSRFTFGVSYGSLYLAQGNHYYLGDFTAGTFYSFVNDILNRTVSVEGVGSTSTTAVSDWHPQLYPVYLFASNVAPNTGTNVNGKMLDTNSLGRIRMKSCSIWENDIPVRKFRPVRVGTDATSWEGAMMDVLTRRIYRNQGTGAFSYGNDLKYPIPAE